MQRLLTGKLRVKTTVTMNEEIVTPPVVLVSSSHDSEEHKKWVRDFAMALRDGGIDVILDQWEIGPGDDVPKFMEQSVRRALRVIMVCTEEYVRKADDGKGGAGYEAMVVTGELVRDLGTRKFIPVIRQTGATPSSQRAYPHATSLISARMKSFPKRRRT